MKIAIVEDNEWYQKREYEILRERFEATQIDVFHDANSFLHKTCIYDIVLLDIELPDVSGLEVMKSLYEEHTVIVFVTSHQKYMSEAFGYHVVQFILKEDIKEKLLPTIIEIEQEVNSRQHYTFKSERGIHRFVDDDIVYMNFDKGVLNLYSIAGEIKIIGKTLKEVEAMLSTSFFAINRSQIVNLNFIELIDVQDVVKLRGKSVVLYVSRYRRKELKQKVRGTLLDD